MSLENKSLLEQKDTTLAQTPNDRLFKRFDAREKYAMQNGMEDDVKNMKEELSQVDAQKQEALRNFDAIEKPLFRQEIGGLKTDTLIAATNLNKETWSIDINNIIQLPIMENDSSIA